MHYYYKVFFVVMQLEVSTIKKIKENVESKLHIYIRWIQFGKNFNLNQEFLIFILHLAGLQVQYLCNQQCAKNIVKWYLCLCLMNDIPKMSLNFFQVSKQSILFRIQIVTTVFTQRSTYPYTGEVNSNRTLAI